VLLIKLGLFHLNNGKQKKVVNELKVERRKQ